MIGNRRDPKQRTHPNLQTVISEHSDTFVVSDRVSGFTIVEMLVAITLFSIMVTIGVSGFAQALRTQRQTNALLAVNSSVSEVIEQMAREIRTGRNFCNSDTSTAVPCTNGADYSSGCAASELAFINANDEQVIYYRDTDASGGGAVMREAWKEVSAICTQVGPDPVTADNVSVEELRFVLRGKEPSDSSQVRITLSLGIRPEDPSLSGIGLTTLQTTVSSRQPDG